MIRIVCKTYHIVTNITIHSWRNLYEARVNYPKLVRETNNTVFVRNAAC